MDAVTHWDNLLKAWQRAARGKRGRASTAQFEYRLADNLLSLQQRLETGSYRPGSYTRFVIREPKRRIISAAPFADRVVHHALCQVIEPVFERSFIADSYANRVGRGTHRAIDRLQYFSRRYRYVLRLDIVKHFDNIDHAILLQALSRCLTDSRLLALCRHIMASDRSESPGKLFPGDDLLALARPRGLPIGNLTSQFWSNCYLHGLDLFVKRQLRCQGYVRYVDDFALFANSKRQLWEWKTAIEEKLAGLRLTLHAAEAQVQLAAAGIPWLGFVVYPTHKRLKRRKVVQGRRHLKQQWSLWHQGSISFAEFDASVRGWVNHVGQGDTWGLRRALFDELPLHGKKIDRR